MSLDGLTDDLHRRFDLKTAAREQTSPAARRAIRASANAIPSVHRGEFEAARALIGDARGELDAGIAAVRDGPDVRFAGYLLDAEKEYAEACIAFALVQTTPRPRPKRLRSVTPVPERHGRGDRRRASPYPRSLLRAGEVERAERTLVDLEDLYGVLVTMDDPDVITMIPSPHHRHRAVADREDARRPVDLVRPARHPTSARRARATPPGGMKALCYAGLSRGCSSVR